MQIQRTIQTVNTPQLLVEVPDSFVHRQVEILIITLDDATPQLNNKRRSPPSQLAGRVKELGDVMASVPVEDWVQQS
ncbi:MAG: hypothetical protein HOP02_10580 [Methylococcaceae bacterium]|nr:hypothetical protein [Methylococcaceae bacterium]